MIVTVSQLQQWVTIVSCCSC